MVLCDGYDRHDVGVVSVNNGLFHGVLVQALKEVVTVAVLLDDVRTMATMATMATSAGAVSEAGHHSIVGHGRVYLANDGATKGGYTERLERAFIIAVCENGITLADFVEVDGVAREVADIVLTFLLAVSRKDLVVVNELASTVVALDLVGSWNDGRGASGGDNRDSDSASAVGGIGEDSIVLLDDDGGKGHTSNLQEEDGNDDKESEGLVVGTEMSALKDGRGAENKRENKRGKQEEKAKERKGSVQVLARGTTRRQTEEGRLTGMITVCLKDGYKGAVEKLVMG